MCFIASLKTAGPRRYCRCICMSPRKYIKKGASCHVPAQGAAGVLFVWSAAWVYVWAHEVALPAFLYGPRELTK